MIEMGGAIAFGNIFTQRPTLTWACIVSIKMTLVQFGEMSLMSVALSSWGLRV
jgi:hypothetical protein